MGGFAVVAGEVAVAVALAQGSAQLDVVRRVAEGTAQAALVFPDDVLAAEADQDACVEADG